MTIATIQRDDRDLGMRFRNGEADTIRELYQRFSGPLCALSRSMLADPDHAADAVQQTFVQAWQASARFDPERSLAAWLFQICRRACIDRYRRERRAASALTATGSVNEVSIDGPSMERAWTVWEVRRAIDGLPWAEREIVRLTHLEGWSFARIADHLGIPVGTVKSRSFRAHRRLAGALTHLRSSASMGPSCPTRHENWQGSRPGCRDTAIARDHEDMLV